MKIYNDHNLYILGAGFSYEANMPLMSTFITELKKAYNWYPKDSYARDSIEAILKFRQLSTSSAYRVNLDLDNIEDLFSLAATDGYESIKLLRTGLCATLEYCKKTAKRPTYSVNIRDDVPYLNAKLEGLDDGMGGRKKINIDSYDYISSVLSGIGQQKNDQISSIISFNYDTILEDSLESIGQDYTYCLKEKVRDIGKLDKTPLVKLHGSMNWLNNGKEIRIKSFDKILEDKNTPFIIPPIWTKSSSDVTNTLWGNALELISSATRIIIIGFSLPKTDLFFRYLLASGLQENISLQHIYIVNPNYSEIEDDVNDLFANNKTKELVHSIPNDTTRIFIGSKFNDLINRPFDERIDSFTR